LVTWSGDLRFNRSEERIDLGELHELSEKLRVPDAVTEEAARICARALGRGLAKGRTIKQITASSLYAACRESQVLTTLDEVAAASGIPRDDIAKSYRLLVTELDLKIPTADPAGYLAGVAARAKVSPEVEEDALKILSKAAKAGVTAGAYPTGLAASALYLASLIDGEYMTQAQAAGAAEVQEATIRKQYLRLKKVIRAKVRRTRRKRPD